MSWIAPDSKLEYSWTMKWRFWLGAYPELISTVLGALGVFLDVVFTERGSQSVWGNT